VSYTSITQAARDEELGERVSAAVQKEAWNSATLSGTSFAELARHSPVSGVAQMMYPVAIDTEAAYESALLSGNPNPGGDPSVITDAAILSAVQAHWPSDPEAAR